MKLIIAMAFLVVLGFMTVQVRAEDKPAAEKPAEEKPAASQPAEASQTIEATETDALKGAEGKTVAVHGTIARVGMSPSGSILFINFQGVDRSGFTAIVHKDDLDAVKEYGEDGADLQGKEVTITGPIKLYKEKPEIEVKKAEQIKVAAGGSEDKKEDKKEDEKKGNKKKE